MKRGQGEVLVAPEWGQGVARGDAGGNASLQARTLEAVAIRWQTL